MLSPSLQQGIRYLLAPQLHNLNFVLQEKHRCQDLQFPMYRARTRREGVRACAAVAVELRHDDCWWCSLPPRFTNVLVVVVVTHSAAQVRAECGTAGVLELLYRARTR